MQNDIEMNSSEMSYFGPIHINNQSLDKAASFWTELVGLKLRKTTQHSLSFGTSQSNLVVVHDTASNSFIEGYSGLYHFALHAPSELVFTKMLQRLIAHQYPFSPIDHIMSKSIYFVDPDGINIEIALETPERFRRVVTDSGLKIEDSNGMLQPASGFLDVSTMIHQYGASLSNLEIANELTIGHIHFYASSVSQSNDFYKKLGFTQFNDLPQFVYADLGNGGVYQHRIALNSWHGVNRPLAPKENAGLKQFQIVYKSETHLKHALEKMEYYEVKPDGYLVKDPTGNSLLLSY